MKKLLPLLGVAAACGACCAIPLLTPLLVGVTASAAGGAVLGWKVGLALLGFMGAVAATLWLRRVNRDKRIQQDLTTPCGCGTAAADGAVK